MSDTMQPPLLHRLDIELAVYPDRVQAIDRKTGQFVDFPADRPFSQNSLLIADAARFEDAVFKAVKQLLSGAFMLMEAKATVATGGVALSESEHAILMRALRNTGFSRVAFADGSPPHAGDAPITMVAPPDRPG